MAKGPDMPVPDPLPLPRFVATRKKPIKNAQWEVDLTLDVNGAKTVQRRVVITDTHLAKNPAQFGTLVAAAAQDAVLVNERKAGGK